MRATFLDDDGPVFETESVTWPTLAPGEHVNFSIPIEVMIPEPVEPVEPEYLALTGFYLDRSRRSEYPVITGWSVPESEA